LPVCQARANVSLMKTEKEKMLSGEMYLGFDEELVRERMRAKKLMHGINVEEFVRTPRALALIKELVPNSGNSLHIEPPFYCDYGLNIEIGDNVYFNMNCVILDVAKVKIGSHVLFGPGVQIYTATHPLDWQQRRKEEYGKAITIGDDCWIGGGAVICPGVIIGNRVVVAAGAVVTKDIPDDTLVGGNPAKAIRKLAGQ
jgi:maltose O-acetyltransferase